MLIILCHFAGSGSTAANPLSVRSINQYSFIEQMTKCVGIPHNKKGFGTHIDPEAEVRASGSEGETGRARVSEIFFPGVSEKNCERVVTS